MSSSLSRGFYSGLFGGMAMGVWIFVWVYLQGGWSIMPDIISLEFWTNYFVFHFGLSALFGAIFGLVYSRFYKGIPGEGVKKGLTFGLIIGVLANLQYSMFNFLNGFLWTGEPELIAWAYVSGSTFLQAYLKWIPYGIVLGIAY